MPQRTESPALRQRKIQSLTDYALVAQASLETQLIPARETVASSPGGFSKEAAARLNYSIERVQVAIDQHWLIPIETDRHSDRDSEVSAESAVGDQTDATLPARSEVRTSPA